MGGLKVIYHGPDNETFRAEQCILYHSMAECSNRFDQYVCEQQGVSCVIPDGGRKVSLMA